MNKSAAFILITACFAALGVNGDPSIDSILALASGVASEVTNAITNVEIPFLDLLAPGVSLPDWLSRAVGTRAPTLPPTPRISTVNGNSFVVYDPAPAPAPRAAVGGDDMRTLLNLYNLLAQPTVFRPPTPSPMPSPPIHRPPSHHGPCHSGCGCGSNGPSCKPERVRIVVVDDCNDKKKKSSESCSSESKSSEEVDVVVPRTGKRTIHYRVRD